MKDENKNSGIAMATIDGVRVGRITEEWPDLKKIELKYGLLDMGKIIPEDEVNRGGIAHEIIEIEESIGMAVASFGPNRIRESLIFYFVMKAHATPEKMAAIFEKIIKHSIQTAGATMADVEIISFTSENN